MRLTGGKDRSRLIKAPRQKGIRPTLDKIRKAIFDILQDEIIGKEILDLFSGSGAIGLEAISRGAEKVYFVEKERICVDTIVENVKSLRYEDKAYVLYEDIFKAFRDFNKNKKKFDIITMDPPYGRFLAKKALLKILTYDIIKNSSLIVIEHSKTEKLPERIGTIQLYKRSSYGDTALSFYKNSLGK